MKYIVGTDEAGYGPNLGPLVICASAWRVPSRTAAEDLYQCLDQFVAGQVPKPNCPDVRVVLADSKVVYRAGEGLCALERTVLTALGCLGRPVEDWRQLWRALEPCPDDASAWQLAWHCDYELALPCATPADELTGLVARLQQGFCSTRIDLVALRTRCVFPNEFNHLVEKFGNKAAVLSQLTLQLAADLVAELGDAPVELLCDKHGGRNFYRPLLQRLFPDVLIEVSHEGQAESWYRWGPARKRSRARFCVAAERFLPVALASMTAKYLREVSMLAFNDFWLRQVPGLRRTAGYPIDAARFKTEIELAQKQLNIDDRVLWRCR